MKIAGRLVCFNGLQTSDFNRLASLLLSATLVCYGSLSSVANAENSSKSISLRDVLSAPFPSSLIGSPASAKYAWVFYEEGRRNIWMAERADGEGKFRSRPVTHYGNDDGLGIQDLQFTPDGRALIYVRGNASGITPAAAVLPATQKIWIVGLKDGHARELAVGHSPAVSPRDDLLAYVSDGQLWLLSLDGSSDHRQALHMEGTTTTLRWSPDGRSIALVSDRNSHSFIGIYSVLDDAFSYIDPSTDKDSEPVWSADSASIGYLRQPWSSRDWRIVAMRSGQPWSVRVANVETGKSHEVFRAPQGRGSIFRGIVAEQQLFWSADNAIIFPSEASGWLHLFKVSIDGGNVEQLTEGRFEVEFVSMSDDRNTLLYSANSGDIDRRHLWMVHPRSGKSTALTAGRNIESAPVTADDGRTVAFLRSSAVRPLQPAVLEPGGEAFPLAPQAFPAEFPDSRLAEPEPVVIVAEDDVPIHGQLFLPTQNRKQGRMPALLYLHGGPKRQMLLGFHYWHYYSNVYAMNQYLASQGYVVLSINYRSGSGYGFEFREKEGARVGDGAGVYKDVLAAGNYLAEQSYTDCGRIGLWGGSYGGYLTALALARDSQLFAAGADVHGVHDWPHWGETTRYPAPAYEPDVDVEAQRAALAASPVANIETWTSPVLLVHGSADRTVPFLETIRLVSALRHRNMDFEQLVLPDEPHGFLTHRTWLKTFTAISDFFDRRLMSNASSSKNRSCATEFDAIAR